MTAIKNIEALGVLAKPETTYNTAIALTPTTDGVQIIKPRPKLAPQYLYDGARPSNAPASYGQLIRAAPRGRFVNETLRIEPKGAGSAYSASNKPPHLSALLRAAGFKETVVTTPGSETVTYAPGGPTDVPTSVTLGLYGANELWTVAGVYCDLNILLNDAGIPVFEFPFYGTLAADPAETALPAITYHTTGVVPPTANGIAFTVGAYTAGIVRNASLKLGRSIQNPRRNLNASAVHNGFTPGPFDPVLTMLLEATPLQSTPFHTTSGLDPYKLRDLATSLSCGWTVGSVQYNKWGVSFPQGIQITDIKPQDDGPSAMWEITAKPYISSPTATDFLSLLWN